MESLTDKLAATLRRGECIGLDAEFTGANEMLELAVADLSGEVIFESLFRPARSRRWSRVPHGITPAMVAGCPKFAWRVPRVQRIVDRCRYMIGFALENDISHLRAEGVERLDVKRVLDLRDWFWLVHGRNHGFDYREGVNLSLIREVLDVGGDDEGDAHRAGFDTRCTLLCFRELLGRFAGRCSPEPATFDEVVTMFDREFYTAMSAYRREAAAGFVSLIVTDEGRYIIKANKLRPDAGNVIECVAVADRRAAMGRLARILTGRPHSNRIVLTCDDPHDAADAMRGL